MDCFVAFRLRSLNYGGQIAPRNDVERHTSAFSRHDMSEVCKNLIALETKGAGNAGRSTRPQPRMQNKKAYELVTTVTSVSPDIPRAMVLTSYRVLSPVIRFC